MSYQDFIHETKYKMLLSENAKLIKENSEMMRKMVSDPNNREVMELVSAVKLNDEGAIRSAIKSIETKSRYEFKTAEDSERYLDRAVQMYDLLSRQLPQESEFGHSVAIKGLNSLMV
jgi:hypothetical protein